MLDMSIFFPQSNLFTLYVAYFFLLLWTTDVKKKNVFVFFFHVAISRGPGCIQAFVTGGDPKDKKWKETETKWEEAEGDRKPQAPGQCPSGPEKSGVCGWALATTRWSRGKP